MSYAASAQLREEVEFGARVESCVLEQTNFRAIEAGPDLDPNSTFSMFIGQIMSNPEWATSRFASLLSVMPSFADLSETEGQEAISDGMILSGVQASWDTIVNAPIFPPLVRVTPFRPPPPTPLPPPPETRTALAR